MDIQIKGRCKKKLLWRKQKKTFKKFKSDIRGKINTGSSQKLWKRNVRLKMRWRDFPGGAVVKNPPANAGDTGSSPGLGRSHVPWSS